MPARSKLGHSFGSFLTAIATSLLVLAGVCACAEMESQDASRKAKVDPAAEPGSVDQDISTGAADVQADVPADAPSDALVELDPNQPQRPGYQMKPSEETQIASAPENGTTLGELGAAPVTLEVFTNVVASVRPPTCERPPCEWAMPAFDVDPVAWSVLGTSAPVNRANVAFDAPVMQVVQFAIVVAAPGVSNVETASTLHGPNSIEQPTTGTTEQASTASTEVGTPVRNASVPTGSSSHAASIAHEGASPPATPAAAETHEANQAAASATETAIRAPMPVNLQPPVRAVQEITGAAFTPPLCTTQGPALPAIASGPQSTPTAGIAVAAPTHTQPPPPVAQVPFPGQRAVSIPTSVASMAFLAAIALAILATAGIARTLSRSVGADGVMRTSSTTGSKMALGMGAMVVLMLGASWLACREVHLVAAGGAGEIASAQVRVASLAFMSVALCIVLGVWLVRGVALPSGRLLENMKRMGAGDLTVQPINSSSRDELGELSRAADKLLAAVRDIVTEVSITSTEVAAAAGEIAAGAQGMSVAAGKVADQCEKAVTDAAGAGRLVENGGRCIDQTAAGIARVGELFRDGAVSVASLGGHGKQIARVVELVSDLSDRTHLVALNASIEAAKAGPNGRAFAVLADEVRRLAERAQRATDDAAETIRGVQDQAAAAADRIARGVVQIKQSADLNGRAGDDLRELARAASGVADTMQTMGSAAEEAGAGAAQSAGAAIQLTTRAEDLKAVLGRFRVDSSGLMKCGAKAM